MSSSTPPSKSGPPVRIRCRNPNHIARELRRRATSDSLFIPSEVPAEAGATQEFLFYVPDGPEVRVEAEVLQSMPPADGGGELPGMLVAFDESAVHAADAIDDGKGEARDRRARAHRTRAAMIPGPRESQSTHSVAESSRVLAALEAELGAMEGKKDHEVLFLGPDADAPAVHAAFSRLGEQYDSSHFGNYGSTAILEAASRILGRMRQAHDRLVHKLQSTAPEPVQLSLLPRERSNPVISDAAALITGEAYVEAQRSLSEALRDNPADRDARIWLLIAQARQAEAWQDFETAKTRYRAALALDRDHEVAAKGLARAAARTAPGTISRPSGRGPRRSQRSRG